MLVLLLELLGLLFGRAVLEYLFLESLCHPFSFDVAYVMNETLL